MDIYIREQNNYSLENMTLIEYVIEQILINKYLI